MRALGSILLVFAVLVAAGCHRVRVPEGGKLRVSLQRIPRHQHAAAMPACAAVGDITVTDQRGTDALGEQFQEYSRPGESVPMVSANDPGPWLADVARAVGSESTLRFGGGPSKLAITLRMLSGSETFTGTFGANYRSRVVFDASLLNSAGKSAFTGTFDADAENYGADQSMENLLEAVNLAAEKALVRLYEDPGFRSAVCGGAGSGAPATTL